MKHEKVYLLPGEIDSVEENVEEFKFKYWLNEGSNYSPLQDSNLMAKVPSKMYEIKSDISSGNLFLKEKEFISDDLFEFKNGIIDTILNDIKNFWNSKERFEKMNLIHKRGILLEGPPGTGKSCAITLLSKYIMENGGIVIDVNNSNVYNTAYFLSEAFRKIEPDTPIILIIEDIDKFHSDHIPYILDLLDGKKTVNNILTIMTSNDSSGINDAILRPGRIDKRYLVPELIEENRRDFFKFKNIPNDIIEEYVSKTEGLNISECKEVLISSYIIGNDINEVIDYIKNPSEKINYLNLKEEVKIEL